MILVSGTGDTLKIRVIRRRDGTDVLRGTRTYRRQ